eukprot:gb/GECG01008757.1/.p1 GENE.gb/GECG01008757.1/~~gb/GECG01008757.1/.p1  ORF type:complete len:338 (+),score=53.33 gb/GECG01008757.1/:1-1014(+)
MEFYPSPSSASYCSQGVSSSGVTATSRQQSSCGAQAQIFSSPEPAGTHRDITFRDRSNTVHHRDGSTSACNQRNDTSGSGRQFAANTLSLGSKVNSTGGKRNDFGRRKLASKRHADDMPMSIHAFSSSGNGYDGLLTSSHFSAEDENSEDFGLRDDAVCLIKRVKAEETDDEGENSANKKVFTEADLSVEQQRHQADLARLETQAELYSIRKEREVRNLKEELEESKASIRGMRQLIEAAASERGKLQSENKVLKRAVATQNQQISQCNHSIEEKDKTIQEQREQLGYLRQLTMQLLTSLQEQPGAGSDNSARDDGDDDGGPSAPGNDNGPFFGTVH